MVVQNYYGFKEAINAIHRGYKQPGGNSCTLFLVCSIWLRYHIITTIWEGVILESEQMQAWARRAKEDSYSTKNGCTHSFRF